MGRGMYGDEQLASDSSHRSRRLNPISPRLAPLCGLQHEPFQTGCGDTTSMVKRFEAVRSVLEDVV